MLESIRNVLIEATEECPLLLETPVGEGLEICSVLEDLSDFYNQFTMDEKKLIRLCVDLCHIWVAGYDPLDYLERWEQIHGHQSISLVHFNDSAKPFKSHVDRHASIGQGYIGIHRLMEIASWCYKRGIPMVVE